MMTSFST